MSDTTAVEGAVEATPAPVTALVPGPGRPRPGATTHLYTDLAREIRASGLMRRRHGWYWWRIAVSTTLFATVWLAVVRLGDSWAQMVPAAVLGVVMTQFGFLGHDAAHRQVFASRRWNEWTSRVCGGLFAGLGYCWWQERHHRHHRAPNQEGVDPDIAPGAIAFTRAAAAARTTGFPGWFVRHQGWLFFPLLALEGLNLQVSSVRTLWAAGVSRAGRAESVAVLLRLVAYVLVLFLLLSPLRAVAFLAVQSAVFGICLGASFAPAHKGMPIIPPRMELDFLRRQVLVSRNVRGSLIVDVAMGGLNYQIEHHLFPSMPRLHLRHAAPIVRAYCAEVGVPYTETGLFASYAIVLRYINRVGLGERDPFDCPLVAERRSL